MAHQVPDHDIATDLTNSCSYLFKALQGAEKAYTVFQRGVTRGICNNFEHRYNVVTGLLTQPIVTLHQEYVEPLMIAGNFLGKAVSKSFDLLRASSSPQEFEAKARPLVAMAKNIARGIYNNPEDALALIVDIVLPSPTSFLRRCATLAKAGKFSHSVQEVKQITQKISTETTIARDLAKTADPLATVADEAIKVAHAQQKMMHKTEKSFSVYKAEANAFEIAKSGGKHFGFYNQYIAKSCDELKNGIKSIEKQIAEHLEKIKNPQKFFPHFNSLDPREQTALISKKWPSDIQRQAEQKRILEGILSSKANTV